MEDFEYDGIWWLPENPDKKITGALKFNPREGANLDLIGSFKEIQELTTTLEPGIILGVTSTGKKVTLYRCYESRSHMGMPGFLTTSFIIGFVFLGYHFKKEEDIIFDSLSISYTHLAEWTRITGFKFKIETDSNNHLVKHEVSYSFPQKVEAKIDNLNISFDYGFKQSGDKVEKYKLEQTTFIKIEPAGPLHFNDYQRNICYHIQNFLSLAIGEAILPLIVKGKNKECKTELPKGRVVYDDIFVFYRVRNLSASLKTLHPFDMFFSFGDIASEFEKCLRNWFSKADVLEPVYDLYFATLYSASMYLQHEFLSLIQAMESYHRRVYSGKYVSDDEYKPMYETLIKGVPQGIEESFKASLKKRLEHLNEFSLRRRLKEVLEKYGDAIKLVISDNETLIDDVVNTRNFLTHYDKSIEKKAKKGHELYILTQRIKFILETCFLIELGVPLDKIKILISRNRRYQYLARQQ